MTFTLRPDVQRFIDEQIKAGRFSSAEAVVEAAIEEFREPRAAEINISADDIMAINRAEQQADRGEGIELEAFRAKISRRFAGR